MHNNQKQKERKTSFEDEYEQYSTKNIDNEDSIVIESTQDLQMELGEGECDNSFM